MESVVESESHLHAMELKPPYYAVIFSSSRRPRAGDGYMETAMRMEELARQQAGFLGVENITCEFAWSVCPLRLLPRSSTSLSKD